MGLNKPNNEIDINTLAQESTSQEIKLSNESIQAVADEILSRIGVTNDTGGGATAGSVFAKLNALLTQIASSGGGIKRIQRGKIDYIKCNNNDSSFNWYYCLVNIPQAINIEKSFLLLYSPYSYALNGTSYDDIDRYSPCGYIYSATQIAIYANNDGAYPDGVHNICWQIIEFN